VLAASGEEPAAGTGALALWLPAFLGSSQTQATGAFNVPFPALAAAGMYIPEGAGGIVLWVPTLTGEYVEPYTPYVSMRGAVVLIGTRMSGPIVT
jgi:hypothetical protein